MDQLQNQLKMSFHYRQCFSATTFKYPKISISNKILFSSCFNFLRQLIKDCRQGPHLTLNPLPAASGLGNQTSKRAIAIDIRYLIKIVLENEKDI